MPMVGSGGSRAGIQRSELSLCEETGDLYASTRSGALDRRSGRGGRLGALAEQAGLLELRSSIGKNVLRQSHMGAVQRLDLGIVHGCHAAEYQP